MIVILSGLNGELDFGYYLAYSQREEDEKRLVLREVNNYISPGRFEFGDFVNSHVSMFVGGVWFLVDSPDSNWNALLHMDESWQQGRNEWQRRCMFKNMYRGGAEIKFVQWDNFVCEIRDVNKEAPMSPNDIVSVYKEVYDDLTNAMHRWKMSFRES